MGSISNGLDMITQLAQLAMAILPAIITGSL